jgi:hypothetical protein
LSLFAKLLELQKSVDKFVKDSTNQSDKYDYASSEAVLDVVRPKLNDLGLLLLPSVSAGRVREGTTKSGTTRFLTELDMVFKWVDVESGETLDVPFYAQGIDLAGEKGVGKANTYAEKFYLMKAFHVPTKKDDPDNDGSTKSGEKKQRGTQAAKETRDYQRSAVAQIVKFFATGDTTEATIVQYYTKNDAQGYAGVTTVAEISDAALPVVYSKMAKGFQKRTGKEFVLEVTE